MRARCSGLVAVALGCFLSLHARADEAPAQLIPTVNLVPVAYRHRLVQQLSLAEENQQQWLAAINAAPVDHREALAFLLVNMPEHDLKTLKGDFLLKNVDLAYQARMATPWGKQIPTEIFFSEVLPYASTDEQRDNWRQDFLDRFLPLVKESKTPGEAAQILNEKVFKTLKVQYHAKKRLRPIQSPFESMQIGYASCTGLSIMLTDACRAVGVPARVVGTPLWFDKSGNHTWTEVWDQQWHFVGSAEPGPLDQTWFVENAAKADPANPENRIYAVSFEQTDLPFFLVLNSREGGVSAVDVTASYLGRQKLTIKSPGAAWIMVRQSGRLIAAAAGDSASFSLAVGPVMTVEAVDSASKSLATKEVTLAKDHELSVDLTP